MFDFSLDRLIYVIPAIIIALTVHEYAHARVAYAFGDPTAKDAGRLTLNPVRHLDVVGTLLLLVAGFGWAKPVPINPFYFQGNRKRKIVAVSIAGPLSNLLEALLAAALLSLLYHLAVGGHFNSASGVLLGVLQYLYKLLSYFIMINVVLAVFNILPIPPLDGSKVLAGLLPRDKMRIVFALERYGFIILLVLAFTNVLSKIISAPANWLAGIIYRLVGL